MASLAPLGPPPSAAFVAQTRVPEILFGSIFPAAIATIFVLARFYSRAILIRSWGWDDTWMLLSWLNGGVVLTVLNCVLTHFGAGRHEITLSIYDAEQAALLGTVCRYLYTVCLWTTKLSICALYLRLFLDRKDRVIVWTIIAYHTIFTIPLLIGLIFRCNPVAANWKFIPGKCQPYSYGLFASAILNIFGDAALLAFIVPKLFAIKNKRQRNFLIGVLGMGVLVIIAAIIRLILLLGELREPDFDVPYASYVVVIWTSVEVNTTLFCAAAPATRPVISLIAPGLISADDARPLDNTAARISNYAEGTMNISRYEPSHDVFELSSPAKTVSGNGSLKLFDLGGLLKTESRHTLKDNSSSGSGRENRRNKFEGV